MRSRWPRSSRDIIAAPGRRRKEMKKYDPKTCITAGELREVGIMVPDTIPDQAWIPRHAMMPHLAGVKSKDDDPSMVEAKIEIDLTVPFRWVRVVFASN
jgi:hypothetical protein